MDIWRTAAPYVLEACGEFGKTFARNLARDLILKPAMVRASTRGEAPPDHVGCPYCAAAKALASAHLYLARARDRAVEVPTYLELARRQVTAANDALMAGPLDGDTRLVVLTRQIMEVEAVLSTPLAEAQLPFLVDRAWTASQTALDLAERYQRDVDRGKQMADEVDAHVHAMEAQVLEVEAKVVR